MIYGISFSESLVDALAEKLAQKYQNEPMQLAKTLVILPTRRACLEFKKAFTKLASQKNLLLPKLMPLYDLDLPILDLPPKISPLEKTLLLAKLCTAKPNIIDFNQALKMAISLSELLNLSYQFELDLAQMKNLVTTDQFASHWQETVQFLDILYTHWPKILQERNQIDPMDRSIHLIRALTKTLQSDTTTSVVIAGITADFPAIKELYDVLSLRDNTLILKENYVKQEDDTISYYTDKHYPQEQAAIEALSKDSWQDQRLSKETFQNVKIINTDTSTEEALTIALILREALEKKDQTAALVTTDRTLSRQVISQMQRWGIQLDDSAGTPLNHTEIGLFFQLLADLGTDPSETNYLALLKHPFAADGIMPTQLRHKVQDVEFDLRKNNKVWKIDLNTQFDQWIKVFKNNYLIPFDKILKMHIEIAESLAKSADKTASERLWQTEAGKQLFSLLTELLEKSSLIGNIEPDIYPILLKLLMQQVSTRPKYGMHPRLDILGPIEARFHHADICVIGGLNEGVFPPFPEVGPWLNRPMRHQLNLPQPETKIDELAMDFAHNFCSKKVYLTRALKVDGAQTLPSRFIERLKVVAKINHLKIPEYRANLAKLIDTPTSFDKITRPIPCPPPDIRPKRLPITQIELLRKNPYAIYARFILGLYPLGNKNKASLFGTLVHDTIKEFLSQNSYFANKQELLNIARKKFATSNLSPADQALMNIKFSAMADFVIEQQKCDLDKVKLSEFEQAISYTFTINSQPFELYGFADRIDLLKNNTLRILDYKTYIPSTKSKVKSGEAPQLSLEAVILKRTRKKDISTLAYWYLTNKKGESEVRLISESVEEVNDLIDKTEQGLIQMISAFQLPDTPYEACPIPSELPTSNCYEHLARMKEWAFTSGDSE